MISTWTYNMLWCGKILYVLCLRECKLQMEDFSPSNRLLRLHGSSSLANGCVFQEVGIFLMIYTSSGVSDFVWACIGRCICWTSYSLICMHNRVCYYQLCVSFSPCKMSAIEYNSILRLHEQKLLRNSMIGFHLMSTESWMVNS